MRQWLILLALTLALRAAPLRAQGDNLIDTLASDPDRRFVTLVTALEAARLAEILGSEGDFTLFAPTDDAFAAALTALDLTLPELLADTATLTDILTYHGVVGRLAAADVAPGSRLISLQGEALAPARDGDLLTINGAAVLEADIAASNGVIHAIDAVLLPPSLVSALAAASPTQTPPQELAHVRLAHFSPDTPVTDVYLDGEIAAEELELLDVSAWIALPPGAHSLVVTPAGTSVEQIAVGPLELLLAPRSWQTVALIGSLGADTLQMVVVPEDYTPIPAGNARLTVFHAVENTFAIDVTASGRTIIIANLAYPFTFGSNDGAFTVNQPAGTFDLQVIRAGAAERVAVAVTPFPPGVQDSPVLINAPAVEFVENVNYLVAAVGIPAAAELLIVPTLMTDVLPEGE